LPALWMAGHDLSSRGLRAARPANLIMGQP